MRILYQEDINNPKLNLKIFIMKRDYVNLKVQVIEVQLSDCIAGSGQQVNVQRGTTLKVEVNGVENFQTDTWSDL